MDNLLYQIGRQERLFQEDLKSVEAAFEQEISKSRFLVVGGAGSIGGAVVRELFARNPKVLHVIDTSENNLAELVEMSDLRWGTLMEIFMRTALMVRARV